MILVDILDPFFSESEWQKSPQHWSYCKLMEKIHESEITNKIIFTKQAFFEFLTPKIEEENKICEKENGGM